jgi:GMP synthase (glutamine-hydrolysing)
MQNGIIILDFGSQYNQLIGRRIREMEVYSEIVPFNTPLAEILEKKPRGIILSGGPSSVNAENAHLVEKELYEQGIPVLGICYGMQLTAHLLGGKVAKGEKGEYGKAHLEIVKENELLKGVYQNSIVWMSHFDEVAELPEGFELNAKSGVIASISNPEKKSIAYSFTRKFRILKKVERCWRTSYSEFVKLTKTETNKLHRENRCRNQRKSRRSKSDSWIVWRC